MLSSQKKYVMNMCKPAKIYLSISMLSILVMLVQNLMDSSSSYCLGSLKCNLDYSNVLVFLVKLVYIGVFTVVVDSLCKNKFKKLAWLLVLLPYILMFVLLFGFISLNK